MARSPFMSGGIYGAVMDPRTRAAGRLELLSGIGGGIGQPDLSSAFQLGDQYAAEDEDVGGGLPGMVGDSTGVSDLHPALIEMTRQAMLDDSPVTSEDKGLALAKAGFAMAAGDSPHALQNIGRGAMIGADALQEMRQQRALQRMREVQAQAMLARALKPSTQGLPEIAKLQSYREQLVKQYGADSPLVKEVDAKIAGAENGPPVFQKQIDALIQANPGMSRQEATNIVLNSDAMRTNRPQQAGLFQLEDGTRVPAMFNPEMRRWEYRDANDKIVPLPFGANPATPSVGAPLSRDKYEAKKLEYLTDVQGIKKLDKYLGTVEDASQGFDLIADQVAAKANTLFDNDLSPEQFATLEGKAKLQQLLGLFRTEVVGPGAMTEYDAQRVLDSLGGDFSALRNKKVVRELLEDMYESKMARIRMQRQNLAYSAPTFGENPDSFEMPEVSNLGKRKPRAKDDAGPAAGSGPDGGAAGAGSGKRRIRIGADGSVIP